MPRGRAAEELIAWTCRRLEAEGMAVFDFTSPPVAGKPGRMYPRAAGGLPDVVGCLRDGRMCVFDVKATHQETWSWGGGVARQRTKALQLRRLERYGQAQALAGVLVVFLSWRRPARAVWVDWRVAPSVSTRTWRYEALLLAGAVEVSWPVGGDPDFIRAALSMPPKELQRVGQG